MEKQDELILKEMEEKYGNFNKEKINYYYQNQKTTNYCKQTLSTSY